MGIGSIAGEDYRLQRRWFICTELHISFNLDIEMRTEENEWAGLLIAGDNQSFVRLQEMLALTAEHWQEVQDAYHKALRA